MLSHSGMQCTIIDLSVTLQLQEDAFYARRKARGVGSVDGVSFHVFCGQRMLECNPRGAYCFSAKEKKQ